MGTIRTTNKRHKRDALFASRHPAGSAPAPDTTAKPSPAPPVPPR